MEAAAMRAAPTNVATWRKVFSSFAGSLCMKLSFLERLSMRRRMNRDVVVDSLVLGNGSLITHVALTSRICGNADTDVRYVPAYSSSTVAGLRP